MKNVIVFFVACLSLMAIGCEKEVDLNSACDLTFPFSGVKWEETNEQPSTCKWMLSKMEYRGSYYYTVGNHCVDMALFVATCDGINICNNNSNLCERILRKGTSFGIVAVEIE